MDRVLSQLWPDPLNLFQGLHGVSVEGDRAQAANAFFSTTANLKALFTHLDQQFPQFLVLLLSGSHV